MTKPFPDRESRIFADENDELEALIPSDGKAGLVRNVMGVLVLETRPGHFHVSPWRGS